MGRLSTLSSLSRASASGKPKQLSCFAAASRPYSSCSRTEPLHLRSECRFLHAETRHDAEDQNDSRPRMSCLAIGIGTAAKTLLEQFSRRKHGV